MRHFKTVESVFSRFGSMINTTLILISACAFVYAWGQYDAGVKNDIKNLEGKVDRNNDDVSSYIAQHGIQVKEHFGDNRAIAAATSGRIESLQKSMDEAARKNDRLEYRITVAESALTTQTENQKVLTDKINDLIGDVKVIKEVVVRSDTNKSNRRD